MPINKEFEASTEGQNHQVDESQTTREMLRRSREQIAASRALLRQKLSPIWHPELPER
jgi:hypothetical protein